MKGWETTDYTIAILKIIDSIVKDTHMGFEGKHIAIKLDMIKTYDRIS